MEDIYAELLQKTAQGDQLAFKQLYEECSPEINEPVFAFNANRSTG